MPGGYNLQNQSGLVNTSNTSVTDTETNVVERNFSDVDQSQGGVLGSKYSLKESSIGNIYTSDYGLVEAGLALGRSGIESASQAAQRTVDAATIGLKTARDVLFEKSESDISKVLKPLMWVAIIALLAIYGPGLLKKKGD